MSDDFQLEAKQTLNNPRLDELTDEMKQNVYDLTLIDLEKRLNLYDRSLDLYDLPQPKNNVADEEKYLSV